MRSGRLLRCACALTAAAAVLGACTRSAPTPQLPPRIVFAETSHDFGHVDQGTTVTYHYAFRNAGDLDLRIDNVRTSCACTAAVTASGAARGIAPGSAGAIEVTFDTADRFGTEAKTVTVYSNDPAQPVTTLTLRGAVDAVVAAEPPELYVGHLSRGGVAPFEVHLVGTEAARPGPESIETRGRSVDATLDAPVAGASGRPIRVTIKRDAPAGRFRDTVVVRVNRERAPALTIPVIGVVDAGAAPSGQAAETR